MNNIKVNEITRRNNRALSKIKAPIILSAKDKDIKTASYIMKNRKCTTQPAARSKKDKKHDDSDNDSDDDSENDSDSSSDDDSEDDSDDSSDEDSEDDSDYSSDDGSDDD
jgi:hypothetical protein